LLYYYPHINFNRIIMSKRTHYNN